MSDLEYQRCKYSITCHTDDVAVLFCLRSLCELCETGVKPQIAWGGNQRKHWRAAGNKLTLRFSDRAFRDTFVEEAMRVMPTGSWKEVGRNDNDPAKRQRARRSS
jgi:hypothetical protein